MSYRREHPGNSEGAMSLSSRAVILDSVNDAPNGGDGPRRYRGRQRAQSSESRSVIVGAVAVHVVAASALYAHLVRALYTLLEDTPRLVVLERGLVRILAASVFLPPFAPTALLIATAIWLGSLRRAPDVTRLLAVAAAALAADSVLRLIGVLVSEPAANVGELLDLPARFSPGPRMLLELTGHEVTGNGFVYWSVVCSLAALVVVWCVARALLEADRAQLDPVEQRRRIARGDPIAALQFASVSALAFLSIAFVGQLALPVVTQLFLQTFG